MIIFSESRLTKTRENHQVHVEGSQWTLDMIAEFHKSFLQTFLCFAHLNFGKTENK